MNHSFDVSVAKEYGLEAAIIISRIQHWIIHNRANNKNFHDGKTWTYNSIKAWAEIIPYLSDGKIRREVDELVEKGVLIKGNYNPSPYDRTTWYAFVDEGLWLDGVKKEHLSSVPNENITGANCSIQGEYQGATTSSSDSPAKKKLDPPLPEIPQSINTPAMVEAWGRWLEYRASKKKPVKGFGAAQAMRDFSEWGVDAAVDAINMAIRNDWQGLFKPKPAFNGNGSHPRRLSIDLNKPLHMQ